MKSPSDAEHSLSAAIRECLIGALELCSSMDELREWNDKNGRKTGKWGHLLSNHAEAVLSAARAKQARLLGAAK